jgi:hypothetical protein
MGWGFISTLLSWMRGNRRDIGSIQKFLIRPESSGRFSLPIGLALNLFMFLACGEDEKSQTAFSSVTYLNLFKIEGWSSGLSNLQRLDLSKHVPAKIYYCLCICLIGDWVHV